MCHKAARKTKHLLFIMKIKQSHTADYCSIHPPNDFNIKKWHLASTRRSVITAIYLLFTQAIHNHFILAILITYG